MLGMPSGFLQSLSQQNESNFVEQMFLPMWFFPLAVHLSVAMPSFFLGDATLQFCLILSF